MKKKLLWAFVLLIVISGSVLFLTARYADRILEPFVRDFFDENKPLNHRVEFGKLKINLIKRQIKINNVRIYPDSSLVKTENVWWEFDVATIKLTDFSIRDFLFHKTLTLGDFLFMNPKVEIHFPVLQTEKVREVTSVLSPKKIKPAKFKSLSLQQILISRGTLNIYKDTVLLASSPDINFIAQMITMEKTGEGKQFDLNYGDVRLDISEIDFNPESSLYEVKLGKFTLSRLDSTIILDGLRLIPLYDKTEFSNQLTFQADRFDLDINRISIIGIGLERWLAGLPLEISKVLIDSLDADLYRDRNVPINLNRFPPYYNELFLKIDFPLTIDSLMVTNSNILYGNLSENVSNPGIIELENFNLSTYGLSNQLTDSTIANDMRIFVNAKVMGEGNLNAELALPLTGNLHRYNCNGSVGTMKVSPLNDMLGPMMNMNFKGGQINRMTFDFTANEKNSKGWMEFLYEDLDVSLLQKDEGKEKGFFSFLANIIMLSNNPASGKDLVTVEIGAEPDKNKGIINYIWKTIQSGMTRTILPQKKYHINKKK